MAYFTASNRKSGAMHKRALTVSVSALALGTLLTASPSYAVDWTGTNSTDWTDPANWSGGVAPDMATPAKIEDQANDPVVDGATVEVNQVVLDNNGSLSIVNGGKVNATSASFIGHSYGTSNTVSVDGAGSQWTMPVRSSLGSARFSWAMTAPVRSPFPMVAG